METNRHGKRGTSALACAYQTPAAPALPLARPRRFPGVSTPRHGTRFSALLGGNYHIERTAPTFSYIASPLAHTKSFPR